MKYAILFLTCVFFFRNFRIDKTSCPNDAEAADIRLEIRANATVLKGGALPNVEAYLVNTGCKLVNLVQPGDGSESGWRTPMVRWSKRIAEIKSVPKELYSHFKTHMVSFPLRFYAGARCGNVDGLKRKQIITLLPKQEVKLDKIWDGQLLTLADKAGKYGVKLFYENKPDIIWKGAGYNDPDALEIVRTKTAAVQLESNELIFEVVE